MSNLISAKLTLEVNGPHPPRICNFDLDEQSVLLIPVSGFEEAQEFLRAIERSQARKKTDVRPEPVKCIAPDCKFDADDGSEVCRDHANATEQLKAEWRAAGKKRTPAKEGARKAREIAGDLEAKS